jgi:probable rRNA maturation factor
MNPPEIEIEVQIDAGFVGQVDADQLTRSALATLRHQGIAGPAALSIVVTGDEAVRRLNRTYRGVDASTDVLSFWSGEESDFIFAPDAPRYLGDVVISFPRAEAGAQSAGHPVEAELQLLTVHGVLHLLGHGHADPDKEATMWATQTEILRDLGAPVADLTTEERDAD